MRVPFEDGHLACAITGDGPPVLLLHNAGNDHHNWDLVVPALAGRHRVIALDMVGFGASSRPRGDYGLDRFAGQIGAVCDALDLDRVDLVGHCVGGAACWRWALDHPERVGHLALFSPATLATMRGGPYGALYAAATSSRLGDRVATSLARASTTFGPTRRLSVRAQFGRGRRPDPAFADHCDALYAMPDNLRVLREVLLRFASFGALDEAGRPEGVPVLLAWGTHNRILPFSASDPVRRRLEPDVDLVLEGCGHLCMREAPERVGQALGSFLSGQR